MKELKFNDFYSGEELVDFVNLQDIARKDIQSINVVKSEDNDGPTLTLFYWEE
jgi:hypothetical protein